MLAVLHPAAAPAAAAPEAVLAAADVDLVYLATPPATHFPQAIAALEAGKHVLVEKPMATTVADAEALTALAVRRGLVCVANLVERYNPLADAVREVIRSRLLGEFIHGLFINEAADEGLGRRHWFWNRGQSGGIFVEHAVHFFDLVSYWLGAGTVVTAARSVRPPGPASDDGDGEARHVRGRFRPFEASAVVEISFTTGLDKLGIYGDVVRDLAADQIAWIRDPRHRRRLTEAESVASVAMACDADRLALAAR